MALHFYWFTEFKLEAKVSNILALEAGSAGLRYTATICLQKLKNRTKHDMLCKYMNYRTHICLAHVLLKHPWGRCQGRIFPLDWMSLDRAILCQTSHAAAMQNAGRQLFLHQLLSNSTAQGNKTGQGLSSKKHLENLSVHQHKWECLWTSCRSPGKMLVEAGKHFCHQRTGQSTTQLGQWWSS